MCGQSYGPCCLLRFGSFLQEQFHVLVTISVLAKDKLRAYSMINFSLPQFKIAKIALEVRSTSCNAEAVGSFDFCVHGQSTGSEQVFVLKVIFWLNTILNTSTKTLGFDCFVMCSPPACLADLEWHISVSIPVPGVCGAVTQVLWSHVIGLKGWNPWACAWNALGEHHVALCSLCCSGLHTHFWPQVAAQDLAKFSYGSWQLLLLGGVFEILI